jgi:hypothetical protein
LNRIETQRSAFEDFGGVKIAHRIDVLKDGHLAMRIRVSDVAAPASDMSNTFALKGHAWRAFTSEMR